MKICLGIALSLGTLVVAASGGAANKDSGSAAGCPRTIYLSVGDHQDIVEWSPIDSKATVEAAFDAMKTRFKADRVWWRGGQQAIWGQEFVFRSDNRDYEQVWKWWKYLVYEGVNTNKLAVQAAHKRRMEIWLTTNLFDYGSAADVSFFSFPFAAEAKIRIEQPECVPVNRYGTWRQGGAIELCYPKARQALVSMLAKYTIKGGYDGIAFLSYCENFSMRYEDEFGFNQPIVDEFKRRHGVDIRTEAFDRENWRKLRGEYLTQFFRELHAALAPHRKKISILVDGQTLHSTQIWNGFDIRSAGSIYCDIETWARDGIVDEIVLDGRHTPETLQKAVNMCQSTSTQIVAWTSRGPVPAGMRRNIFVTDLEHGYDFEDFIHSDDEKLEPQRPEVLMGKDRYAKRRLLTNIVKRTQSVPTMKLVRATRDKDVYVRRMALRALGSMQEMEEGDRLEAILATEAALNDSENSVRCQAALTLARLAPSDCVSTLLAAVPRDPDSFQFNFRAIVAALKILREKDKLGVGEMKPLVAGLRSENLLVRVAALYCLRCMGAPHSPTVEEHLFDNLRKGSRAERELAIINLRSTFGPTPRVMAALEELAKDADPATQMRAGVAIALLKMSIATPEKRTEGIRDLIAQFRQYGDGCQRGDVDWGWRVVGNTLLQAGDDGRAALEALIDEKQNRRLAELAWRVIYIRQDDAYRPVSEEEDRIAHQRYPFPFPGLAKGAPVDAR